jgi:hypothetical protein
MGTLLERGFEGELELPEADLLFVHPGPVTVEGCGVTLRCWHDDERRRWIFACPAGMTGEVHEALFDGEEGEGRGCVVLSVEGCSAAVVDHPDSTTLFSRRVAAVVRSPGFKALERLVREDQARELLSVVVRVAVLVRHSHVIEARGDVTPQRMDEVCAAAADSVPAAEEALRAPGGKPQIYIDQEQRRRAAASSECACRRGDPAERGDKSLDELFRRAKAASERAHRKAAVAEA